MTLGKKGKLTKGFQEARQSLNECLAGLWNEANSDIVNNEMHMIEKVVAFLGRCHDIS